MVSQNAQPPDDPADRIFGTAPASSVADEDAGTTGVLRRRRRPTVIPKLQGRRPVRPATAEDPLTVPAADPDRSARKKMWWLSAAAALAIVMIATGIGLSTGHPSSPAAAPFKAPVPQQAVGAGSITTPSPAGSPGGPGVAATRTVATRATSPSPKASSKSGPKSGPSPKGLANPAGVDLALHRPVTASGSEGDAWAPAEAVDGDLTTRWSSAFADPQWIRIDLGALRRIKQVRLSWERSYAVAFQVQTSADGHTWKSVYRTGAGRGGTQTIKTPKAVGRYVRVYGTERVTAYGYSLFEIDVR